jgi:hypothetical protein
MSGKQRAVLWIGLIIIALNLVSKWSEIKSVIFANPSTAPSAKPPSSTPGIGGLPFPLNIGGLLSNTPATNTVTPV